MNKKHGFTLAEILITLTVIGVVAALTIPTLLQNTNQAEFKTALKRDFSDLSQATLQIQNDNGGSLVNAFRNGAGGNLDSENLKNAFKGKLSYLKDCSGISGHGGTGNGASTEGCWHTANNWKRLNGTLLGNYVLPGLILSNGTLISMAIESSTCQYSFGFTSGIYRCGIIDIDVNGFKPPNTIGKDIFTFSLIESELIPNGAKGTFNGDCTPSGMGYSCTALYLYQQQLSKKQRR